VRNISDYELSSAPEYQKRERSAAELMGMAVSVAEGLLSALEDFSPGEAEDGCHCPIL